ncbi:MAG: 3D domain-containing protein [Patescibacteria group bacterium]
MLTVLSIRKAIFVKYYRHAYYLVSAMRYFKKYLLYISIITVFVSTALIVNATSNDTANEPETCKMLKGDGITCEITNDNDEKAQNEELIPEKFTVNASAYTAAADECGKSDGITASGNKVRANHTLACPPGYEFGTQIHIEGMGTYTCEDRGGAIKGNHFDIYMETKAEAFAFGRRNLIAYVVE